jgi:hypothetical protein
MIGGLKAGALTIVQTELQVRSGEGKDEGQIERPSLR